MQAIKFSMLGIIGMVGLLISAIGPFKVPFAETLAKTYYRHAIVGLVLVVTLVGGLIAAVVNLFDPNQFKGQIVHWVQERTQRDLVLDGELKMIYFPRLGLETGKASLSQRRSAREFAALDKARVTVAWLPLFRRELVLHSAELDGLRAQLLRFKDGSTNVDDLVKDLATIAPQRIDLDRVSLSKATLQWNDELAWQRGSLHDLQIELGHLADGQAGPLSASARIDAPGAGVDARLQLRGRLLFDSANGKVELARIEGQLEGKALGVDNLALDVRGDVTAVPGERSIAADNVVITSTSKSGLSISSARLTAQELRWGAYRLVGAGLAVELSSAHPDRTTTLALQVPRFEWFERALRDTAAQWQLALRSPGTLLRAQGGSAVQLSLDGGPRVEFGGVELTASASHPALAAEVVAKLGGRIELDFKQGARAMLSGKVAASDLRLDAAVADFGRPRWTIDVEADRLDADTLLAPAWLARWGDDATPIDASSWRDTTLQGSLRVGQFKLGGVKASAVSAAFALDHSVLQVEPVVAQAYGAALAASLRVEAGAVPHVASKGSFSEIDLRSLTADLARVPWLEGSGAVSWDLTGDGASVGSLRSALAGGLSASLRGGALSGVDLRAALLDGRADLGKRVPAQPREFNTAASTPFSEIKARLELREGRALGQQFELASAAIRATGGGDLRLDTGVLDLRLLAAVGRGAPELASLADVSVPVQVHGPWRQPRFAFDFGAATGAGVPRAAADAGVAPLALASGAALDAAGAKTVSAAK